MGKYIRLLRLTDHYFEITAVTAAGLFVRERSTTILFWISAVVFLGFAAFILNEITDRSDTDKLSWNSVHIRATDVLDARIVSILFILCSLAGLYLSFLAGLVWWGMAIYIIAILYSLKPIRFKGIFGLDLASQMAATWILPFLAPVWGVANNDMTIAFIIITSVAVLGAAFPYQIADIEGDQKAGLHSTHVVLGVDASLRLGLILAIIAAILYLIFGMYMWASFTIPGVIFLPIMYLFYGIWISLRGRQQQLLAIQQGVRVVKFLTQIGAIYLFILWILI